MCVCAGAEDVLWFVLVAVCWGFTNPFIARGAQGIKPVHHANPVVRRLLQALAVLTRWQYVVPLALNLSGSLLYYATLSHAGRSRKADGGPAHPPALLIRRCACPGRSTMRRARSLPGRARHQRPHVCVFGAWRRAAGRASPDDTYGLRARCMQWPVCMCRADRPASLGGACVRMAPDRIRPRRGACAVRPAQATLRGALWSWPVSISVRRVRRRSPRSVARAPLVQQRDHAPRPSRPHYCTVFQTVRFGG